MSNLHCSTCITLSRLSAPRQYNATLLPGPRVSLCLHPQHPDNTTLHSSMVHVYHFVSVLNIQTIQRYTPLATCINLSPSSTSRQYNATPLVHVYQFVSVLNIQTIQSYTPWSTCISLSPSSTSRQYNATPPGPRVSVCLRPQHPDNTTLHPLVHVYRFVSVPNIQTIQRYTPWSTCISLSPSPTSRQYNARPPGPRVSVCLRPHVYQFVSVLNIQTIQRYALWSTCIVPAQFSLT